MSEPRVSAENEDRARAVGSEEQQPTEAYGDFFRFRPIAFVKHFFALAKRHDSAKGKRDYYTDAIRNACVEIVTSRTIQWVSLVAAIILSCYLLYQSGVVTDESGKIDPNWIIALFTIVMAATTYFQWQAIRVANNEFTKQNEIMIEQTRQTDRQLNLTWMQLQPWLAVIAPELSQPFVAGEPMVCRLPVHNTGNTPATITRHLVIGVALPAIAPTNGIIAFFERHQKANRTDTLVPAQRQTDFEVSLNTLDQPEIDAIGKGEKKLYVLARFGYKNAIGDPGTLSGYYVWHPAKQRLMLIGGGDSGEVEWPAEK